MPGFYIFKGIRPVILKGDLQVTVDENGAESMKVTMSSSFDVVAFWIKIAHGHLKNAKEANADLLANWGKIPDCAPEYLIKEMETSLQTIVGCAIAIDALYAVIKPHAVIDKAQYEQWRTNKTGRSVYVSEVVRRVYRLDKELFNQVRTNLKETYDWRDRAVHPSPRPEPICQREDIDVGVDWKFAYYRHKHASIVYQATVGLILQLHHIKSNISELDESLSNVVNGLLQEGIVKNESGNSTDGVIK